MLQTIKAKLQKLTLRNWLIIAAVVAVAIFAGTQAWHWYHPAEKASTAPTVTQEAPKAVEIPKVAIPAPKTLTVYERKKFVAAIPLPPEVKANPANEFTATAVIKPSPYGGTAVAFTNMTTGVTGITYQAKPAPFFELKSLLEISGDYGYSTRGQVIQGSMRYTPLRIGPANLHIRGEVGTNGGVFEGKALAGIHGEFDIFK
jgi:hypothetical protein